MHVLMKVLMVVFAVTVFRLRPRQPLGRVTRLGTSCRARGRGGQLGVLRWKKQGRVLQHDEVASMKQAADRPPLPVPVAFLESDEGQVSLQRVKPPSPKKLQTHPNCQTPFSTSS